MTWLVGDCASDPPLSATARTLAVQHATDLLYGLGMVAIARGHTRLAITYRHQDAGHALAEAIAGANAHVELWPRPNAWPTVLSSKRQTDLSGASPSDSHVHAGHDARARAAAGDSAEQPDLMGGSASDRHTGGAAASGSVEQTDLLGGAWASGSVEQTDLLGGAWASGSVEQTDLLGGAAVAEFDPGEAELVDARVLVAAAEAARGLPPLCYLTVAGAVGRPTVMAAQQDARVSELVARAGGAEVDDWVAIGGGAPAGRLPARDAFAREIDGVLLILPAGHEVVRRLRTPVADWLMRAASACEGCRVCSDACPALAPHEIVWTLASGRDDGIAPVAALACTGCGLCDAMCPAVLSPRVLVTGVRDRLVAMGAQPGDRPPAPVHPAALGLDVELLTARLGLAPYDKPVGGGGLGAAKGTQSRTIDPSSAP